MHRSSLNVFVRGAIGVVSIGLVASSCSSGGSITVRGTASGSSDSAAVEAGLSDPTGATAGDAAGETGQRNDRPNQTDDGVDPDSAAEADGTDADSAVEADGTGLTGSRRLPPAPEGRSFEGRGELQRPFDFALTAIADLPGALGLALRPGSDSLYIALQPGFVVELRPNGDGSFTQQQQLVLNVADRTESDRERGLLGIAFSPDAQFLYAVWTDANTGANQLVEFPVGPDGTIDVSGERLVLEVAQPARNHNGGQIAFGPDGYLYYGLGDGGGSGDMFANGQNPFTLLGTIVRLDPQGDSPGEYTIPDDNPFVDGADGAPEVWAWGLRNPWRFSFDTETGDLWIADVGQSEFEEISVLWAGDDNAGANLGWDAMEGLSEYNGTASDGFVDPIFDYAHGSGCSITGGYVYRGSIHPSLVGSYVYADYCSGEIRVLDAQGSQVLDGPSGLPDVGRNTLASFGEGPDGELYVIRLTGSISRIDSLR